MSQSDDPVGAPPDEPAKADSAVPAHPAAHEHPVAERFADDLKEQYRQQMLSSLGGFTGTVIAAIPTVVFVVVNAVLHLGAAVIAAVASAVALSLMRLAQRKSVQQALSGLLGVVVAALIAARTGQAKGYFLLGIWTSFIYGTALLATVLARRPLAGLFWEFLDPTPQPGSEGNGEGNDDKDGQPGESTQPPLASYRPSYQQWYQRRPLRRAYMWATSVGAAVFLVRGTVQATLFRHNATGWLAAAKIVLGVPPYLAAVAFGVWLVRRARAELAASGS